MQVQEEPTYGCPQKRESDDSVSVYDQCGEDPSCEYR